MPCYRCTQLKYLVHRFIVYPYMGINVMWSQTYVHTYHTMAMLSEKFQWLLPLYLKPIIFQTKASVVCSVNAAGSFDFCLKKLKRNFCVNFFLRYYLMMQQLVKRVHGAHESAHKPYQLLSGLYHCCLNKNTDGKMKVSHPRAADRWPFVPRHS